MCSEQSHGIAGRHLENVAIQKVLADYVLVPARNRTQYEIPPTRKLLGLGEELHLHLEHSPPKQNPGENAAEPPPAFQPQEKEKEKPNVFVIFRLHLQAL